MKKKMVKRSKTMDLTTLIERINVESQNLERSILGNIPSGKGKEFKELMEILLRPKKSRYKLTSGFVNAYLG